MWGELFIDVEYLVDLFNQFVSRFFFVLFESFVVNVLVYRSLNCPPSMDRRLTTDLQAIPDPRPTKQMRIPRVRFGDWKTLFDKRSLIRKRGGLISTRDTNAKARSMSTLYCVSAIPQASD